MARKRSSKKKNSSKKKQSKQNNSQASSASASASPGNNDNTGNSNNNGVHEDDELVFSPDTAQAGPFFSPPTADLMSLFTPTPRPIHTPYSSRRSGNSSSNSSTPIGDEERSNDNHHHSTSLNTVSPARSTASDNSTGSSASGASSTSSSSNTPRNTTPALVAQVHDLNALLTSPLGVHLGDLANTSSTNNKNRPNNPNNNSFLGPLNNSGEDDDMSEEWDHLAQSESMLREELESFNFQLPSSSSSSSGPAPVAASSSLSKYEIPPAIARQRLDPSLSSPLHPFALFPSYHGRRNNSHNFVCHNSKSMESEDGSEDEERPRPLPSKQQGGGGGDVLEEKKEGSPHKAGVNYVSPPRPRPTGTLDSTTTSSSIGIGSTSRASTSLGGAVVGRAFAKEDEDAAKVDADLQMANSLEHLEKVDSYKSGSQESSSSEANSIQQSNFVVASLLSSANNNAKPKAKASIMKGTFLSPPSSTSSRQNLQPIDSADKTVRMNNRTYVDDEDDEASYARYNDQADAEALQMATDLYGSAMKTSPQPQQQHVSAASLLAGKFKTPSDYRHKNSNNNTTGTKNNQTLFHSAQRTTTTPSTGDTRYHTALKSEPRRGDYTNGKQQRQQYDEEEDEGDLGREFDHMVNSLPMFSPSPSRTSSELQENSLSKILATSPGGLSVASSGSSYMDPEISHLIQSVQEQLRHPAKFLETPPSSKHSSAAKSSSSTKARRTARKPAISRGVLFHDEPDGNGNDVDTIHSADFADEDDDLGYELGQLETSQNELREALAVSLDDYSLPSNPNLTPASPPKIVDDWLQYEHDGKRRRVIAPLPVVQRISHSPPPPPSAYKAISKNSARKQKTPALKQQQHQKLQKVSTTKVSTMMEGIAAISHDKNARKDQTDDLQFYHYQDPEVQMLMSSSTGVTSTASTSQSDDITNTHSGICAIGSTSDTTISTITGAVSRSFSLDTGMQSPSRSGDMNIVGKLNQTLQLSPVSNASSASPPPVVNPVQARLLKGAPKSSQSRFANVASQLSSKFRYPPPGSPERKPPQEGDGVSVETGQSTPKRSGRGESPQSAQKDSFTTLNRLVRTPSPDNANDDPSSTKRPFQFVEADDDSFGPSEPIMPFAPEELSSTKSANCAAKSLGTGVLALPFADQHADGSSEVVYHSLGTTKSVSQLHQRDISFSPPEIKSGQVDSIRKKYEVRALELGRRLSGFETVGHRQEPGLYDRINSPETPTEAAHLAADESNTPRRQLIQLIRQSKTISTQKGAPPVSPQRRSANNMTHVISTSFRSKASPSHALADDDMLRLHDELSGGLARGLSSTNALPATKGTPDSPRRRGLTQSLSGRMTPSGYLDVPSNDSRDANKDTPEAEIDIEAPDSRKHLLDEAIEISDEERKPRNWKRGCLVIGLVWLLVMAIVVALTVMIVRSNRSFDDSESVIVVGETSTNSVTQAPSAGKPTELLPSFAPTMAASPAPTVVLPSPPEIPPTLAPVWVTTPDLQATTVAVGTSIPVNNVTLSLVTLIIDKSVDRGQALLDRTSPEYASLVWLANTPQDLLQTYSNQQKVQRFVLGTVFYSMNGAVWTENSRWMSNEDECTWFSRSRRAPGCNKNGEYVSLELGFLDVSGTIPRALGMLSNSLERLDIEGGPSAFITGTIVSTVQGKQKIGGLLLRLLRFQFYFVSVSKSYITLFHLFSFCSPLSSA